LGSRPDDVLFLGDCDDGVRRFADALGWREEVEALWAETDPNKGKRAIDEHPKTRDEKVKDEVEKLTEEIDRALNLSSEHRQFVSQSLGERDGEGKKSREKAGKEAETVPKLNSGSLDEGDEGGAEGEEEIEENIRGGLGSVSKAEEAKDGVGTGEEKVAAKEIKDSSSQGEESLSGGKSGDGSLGHVFPHMDKKS